MLFDETEMRYRATPAPTLNAFAEGARQTVTRLRGLFSRLICREPGFSQAQLDNLSRILEKRNKEAEDSPSMTEDDLYKEFVLPIIEAQTRRFEERAREPKP